MTFAVRFPVLISGDALLIWFILAYCKGQERARKRAVENKGLGKEKMQRWLESLGGK